jgi:hypothetical protein
LLSVHCVKCAVPAIAGADNIKISKK